MVMGKTGGGVGANQHAVKGLSVARGKAASRKPAVPDDPGPGVGSAQAPAAVGGDEPVTIDTFAPETRGAPTAEALDWLRQIRELDGDSVILDRGEVRAASGRVVGESLTVSRETWGGVLFSRAHAGFHDPDADDPALVAVADPEEVSEDWEESEGGMRPSWYAPISVMDQNSFDWGSDRRDYQLDGTALDAGAAGEDAGAWDAEADKGLAGGGRFGAYKRAGGWRTSPAGLVWCPVERTR
jgi:hypothetical protein